VVPGCSLHMLVANDREFELLASLSTSILVTLVCIADSKVIGKPMVPAAHMALFFTWPITAPIYLIWSRGAKGVIVLAAHIGALTILLLGFFLIREIML